MNNVKVLLFATLKDRAGIKEVNLELAQGAQVGELKRLLGERFPNLLTSLPSALVAVNREFAFDEDPIPAGAEIALFPPVSGG